MRVVVTGASGGIGSALVERLLTDGHRVAAIDVRAAVSDRDAPGLSTYRCDLASYEQTEEAVRRFVADAGGVEALVNVAGTNLLRPFTELSPDDWAYVLRTNLFTLFNACRATVPHMIEAAQGGAIVNFSSTFAFRGQRHVVPYAASKAGVVGFTRALAAELAPHAIRVNAVAPAATLTARVAAMPEEFLAEQLAHIPLGRFTRVEDVVNAVCFLISSDASDITGQTLSVSGGDVML
ncbi:MAG: SDR family oxidoreductase [Firmicutes bacterium]|nr:SDR family oxidoreductase [Bacillota bacterium]